MQGLDAQKHGVGFRDGYGREINYLRLSVTDRCNLRCFYCNNNCENPAWLPHKEILSYEECLSLLQVACQLGVNKVRLTGGEPFVRKDFVWFLSQIVERFPDLDLRVTSNGSLLEGKIEQLQQIGLKGLNISLDTLQRSKFEQITGKDQYLQVRENIDRCLGQGLRIKVNVVAMRGINDSELQDFLVLAQEYPLDLRFIEFMPIGENSVWGQKYYWSADEILRNLEQRVRLVPLSREQKNCGPARMFQLSPGLGRVGVISPLSHHFCATCNRFRITPDGRLRTCLFSDREYRLRPILRNPDLSLQQVYRVMRLAGAKKPLGHDLLQRQAGGQAVCQRIMSTIGG
ncbi:MAG: GTP 3',8-cyclase MoaA [Thermodesulfobacteriota bacterium]